MVVRVFICVLGPRRSRSFLHAFEIGRHDLEDVAIVAGDVMHPTRRRLSISRMRGSSPT
jgi:hypothetical protein